MAKGSSINKQGVKKFMEQLQGEFAKHQVTIPVQADPDSVLPAPTVNNYHAPVVTVSGDHAQIAWNNDTVTQSQAQAITAGFESLAELVATLLEKLPTLALAPADEADFKQTAGVVLGEVVKAQPDGRVLRRGVTGLKGILASVALGVGAGITDEAVELAKHAVTQLGATAF